VFHERRSGSGLNERKNDNVDTTQTITHISLCSGYGGIDLGLRRCIPGLRTIAYSEIEAAACELLLARMEGGQLDPAPIWTDLKSFPWGAFHGKVDIVSGGYPCQPFSAAGKRAGKDDPRHLWPWIADGIAAMQPRLCFFKNVEGHISLGLSTVVSDLEELGYRAAWGLFSASEVGAPHQRKRVFILAYRNGTRLEGNITECARQKNRCEPVRSTARCSGSGGERDVANTMCDGSGKSGFVQQRADGPESVSDGKSRRTWPSRPGEPQHEWEPLRAVEPGLGRNTNGITSRVDRLRMLGNGVVPATAERAFQILISELQNQN
jgi:DNA (cytosine-5)-methyltransferase 1